MIYRMKLTRHDRNNKQFSSYIYRLGNVLKYHLADRCFFTIRKGAPDKTVFPLTAMLFG